ncbi:MAG: hypothetical protein AB7V46_05605 [Thermomicrobiales bacterium]
MEGTCPGLSREIVALRSVLERLLNEERDLSRLVAGTARLTTAIVQAERLQHQLATAEDDEF